MAADFGRVKAVFLAALDRADPRERDALLRDACGDDTALRRQVEALLRQHEAPGSFLGPPAADPAATDAPSPDTEAAKATGGASVGPYRLVQKLGEGGMGTVWLAEQSQPVKRRVALKLIKAGMDTARVVARFEQERQALALMDHPHIAKVLDACATAQGRPYFVMELVKGIPITRYCDQECLTPRERLRLFIPVCQAVQHAHTKGIIHRDLKPSNVLVAPYDGRPVPKVIDFGVAKATGPRLGEESVVTEVGSLVGTLEYMAPEQAELNNLDVDTRADVYSLGVLLYELLAGSPPFTAKQLRGAALPEVLRMIREVEPPTPSTRLSLTEELPAIAAKRKVEPRRLAKVVRGELDWVVMKCLEKDRARRYETADALALDLDRFLKDEPVAAGPPSAGYRLRKFVRRNRGPVLAVALVVAALVAGIAGSTWQAVRAGQAEGVALDERDAKDEALKAALASERKAKDAAEAERDARTQAEKAAKAEALARELAQKRLGQVEKANELVASIFQNLDPSPDEKDEPPLKERLLKRIDEAAAQLKEEAIGDAVAMARLQQRLGWTYMGLAEWKKAIAMFGKARQAFQAELGPDDLDTVRATIGLAQAYQRNDQVQEALPLLKQVLDARMARLGPDDHETLATDNSLAHAYQQCGQLSQALSLFLQTLEKCQSKLGKDHRLTLTLLNNVAAAYQKNGQVSKAIPFLKQSLDGFKASVGSDHPDTCVAMHNLALAHQVAGQVPTAIALFEVALKGRQDRLGTNHPDTLLTMHELAAAYHAAGRLPEALRLFKEALEGRRTKLGPDHSSTLTSMNGLAVAYKQDGQLEKAIPLFEEALKGRRARLGDEHPKTLLTMNNLAMAYRAAGKRAEALGLFEEVLKGRRAKLGHDHADTINTMVSLIRAYEENRQLDRAESLLRELLRLKEKKDGPHSPATANVMAELGRNLLIQKEYDEAETVLRACLAITKEKMPDHWLTFSARSMLGGALLGRKKYDEAEPLLLGGYTGFLKVLAKTPPVARDRLDEARARLVDLYEATGQKEKAEQYRK
jgi:serine/threonine protein kinase/tetratricopeptide (TPR) repeat protein